MENAIGIAFILLPIVIVGAIALFVIQSLKAKQKKGTLGNKKTAEAQTWLNSLIPLGLVFGSTGGVLFSLFSPVFMGTAISLGAALGLLCGYFAYDHYSKTEETPS